MPICESLISGTRFSRLERLGSATVETAVLLLIAVVGLAGCADSSAPVLKSADLVLINGKIVTVDPDLPEAEALAISGDTIAAVGGAVDIEEYIGPDTEVVDLEGRLAIPGFIEGHAHFFSLGRSKMILALGESRNWAEIVSMVGDAAATAEPGEWITGRGWHQEKWDSLPVGSVDGVPTHHDLSKASPENPVLLTHASGHAAFANREALRASGISSETPNPRGGEIVRDARGEPTGLLRETAQRLGSKALARSREQMTEEERENERRIMARKAAEEALANGVTTFHDAGADFDEIDVLKRLAEEGDLPLRLYVMIRASNEELADKLADYRLIGYGGNRLTVRSIKWSIDGALGSHGAWLLKPYSDMPTTSGLNTAPLKDVIRTTEMALEHDFQVAVHAIGDRANREVLDIYQRTFDAASPQREDRRWRIEHAQHLHPDDIDRFSELGVIPSMQGIHCTSDAPWVIKRLGEKRAREGAYMWQALWQSGAVVANGTDAPVEKIDPIQSFYATVTRRLADSTSFYPDQKLSREQALQSYTLNNAFAAFEEDVKGSLTPGKLADVVVLSEDIMTIPDEDIPTAEVDLTIVGGRIVFNREP
ncbi:MAG: amidohydrolase [Rhodothermia bacterium]|nr:amidohydrolase [Rhodothermia bacterium]